ncbi:hypothetical protein [Pseudooceanicola nitratireducens]|uniref:hypothetical protein n=1 Tax=Pseudooceanicola nitratireducens TaxID=517719 RepID=UPI001C9614ED|nr:hypothetical protein [Pseudooceanicola nitratireducens]MBY6157825.1 hypothetical protein [Pseudooceanicola nitratireducens]
MGLSEGMWRLCLILLLAGCAAPTLGFRGAVVSDHVVEGCRFKVYHSGDQAQAVRINRQFAPRIGPLAGRAAIAMQQGTGCRVTEMAGDAAVLVARLSCGAPHPSCKVDAVLKGRRGFRLPVVRDCP